MARPLLVPLPILASLLTLYAFPAAAAPDDAALDKVVQSIRWLGQASLRIDAGGTVVYLDPVGVGAAPRDAALVLVTHDHPDPYSRDDILRIVKPSGLVVAPFAIDGQGFPRTAALSPGKSLTVGQLTVQAVPAYNVVKTFHPKAKGYVGYLLSFGGVRIYVAGDTERIPEMKTFSCDIAFLPLGQTYTMSGPEEAAQAAVDVKARIAIPYHWGTYEGTRDDALTFQRLLQGKARVVILEKAR